MKKRPGLAHFLKNYFYIFQEAYKLDAIDLVSDSCFLSYPSTCLLEPIKFIIETGIPSL